MAIILSFLLFDWWLPLVCLAVGYWIIAPISVKSNGWAFYSAPGFIASPNGAKLDWMRHSVHIFCG